MRIIPVTIICFDQANQQKITFKTNTSLPAQSLSNNSFSQFQHLYFDRIANSWSVANNPSNNFLKVLSVTKGHNEVIW